MPLQTSFLGIKLKNPITTGAGTFGYGEKLKDFLDVSELGSIVIKGTSLKPWHGNRTPRIHETPSGMLNCIGLQNKGLDYFISHTLPKVQKLKTKVIVSIFDKSADNYAKIAKELDNKKGIVALEINLSCPNLKAGGITFCSKSESMEEVIVKVRKSTKLPILAKLSPNVTDIVDLSRQAIKKGANGLTLINTLVGMSINVKTKRPNLSRNLGGLSGPAIMPVALANVWKVHRAMPKVPILGIGGVHNANSALQMILAGATLVGVGTANFFNPKICLEIIKDLYQYCRDNNMAHISDLVGLVQDYS